MTRRRAPERDFVCLRCGCACTGPEASKPRHLGGGPGMKACGKPPRPILRSELDREAKDAALAVAFFLRRSCSPQFASELANCDAVSRRPEPVDELPQHGVN